MNRIPLHICDIGRGTDPGVEVHYVNASGSLDIQLDAETGSAAGGSDEHPRAADVHDRCCTRAGLPRARPVAAALGA